MHTELHTLASDQAKVIQESTMRFVAILKTHLETESVPARIAWLNKTIAALELALSGATQ